MHPDSSTPKRCTKCQRVLSAQHFTREIKNPDGLKRWCRDCNKAYLEDYRRKNHERLVQADRVYYASHRDERVRYRAEYYRAHRDGVRETNDRWAEQHPDLAREVRRQGAQRYRERHPDRIKAQDAVKIALCSGKLQRQPCEVCGTAKTDAHHYRGYAPEHRLDVLWLCRRCHAAVHRSQQ